jgi:hypothetical protein
MRRLRVNYEPSLSPSDKEMPQMNAYSKTYRRLRRAALLGVVAVAPLLASVLGSTPAQAAECALEPKALCFAFESAGVSLSGTQAGEHADLTTAFKFVRDPNALSPEPYGNTENLTVKLPPGITGNPNAVPQCDPKQLTTPIPPFVFGECPVATQVGVNNLIINGNAEPLAEPVYNMEPPGGDVVARLGFIAGQYPVFINLILRPDYGITAKVEGAPSQARLLSAEVTLWGVPASPSHDTQRETPIEVNKKITVTRSAGIALKPFLSNPTSCGSPGEMELTATTYQASGVKASKSAPWPEIGGCENVDFDPALTVSPTSRVAASPSGLDAELRMPQNENPKGLATSELRQTSVVLPPGMTIASGAADGLAACNATEVGFEKEEASHCPDAAKIGSATFVSPALSEPLQGSIYQRRPAPGHLFRLWLVADGLGAHVKIPGEIQADPKTGQLTSIFTDTPQLPVEDIELHVRGGSRGPLSTPGACGTYQTHFEFTPWTGRAATTGNTPMTMDEGCKTGGFSPKLSAGSLNPFAGKFSTFVTSLTRESGEANIAGLDVTLPKGLAAKLDGVPLCPSTSADSGNCPAGSQIGKVSVATGPGPTPLWIPQPGKAPTAVYLSGPYETPGTHEAAPYSLVIKVPAQAGPFDLGTVITRAGIYVNPETAQVTVKSEPLPQILEGVPISYRDIHVEVDRPEFAINPTNCEALQSSARVTSNHGAVANPTDGFQATNCAKLGFDPNLSLSVKGGAKRGSYQKLRAVLKAKKGQANIGRVSVALPHSEFLAQEHINTICTRVQFAANSCPKGSIYGHARAFTPLLSKPLEGPVYLRSSSHPLPDLVMALNGQIDIDLVGRIDSVNGGIRNTFDTVPDAPVTKFVLEMKGGKKSLLVNSRNLCAGPNKATVKMNGQNGRLHDFRPVLGTSCGKKK